MEMIQNLFHAIRDPKNSNAIIAVFTVLIFFTGVFYTIFARRQWKEMSKANANTQQQLADARAVQSAQLSVEPPEITVSEEGGGVYANGIIFRVTNVGQTAAKDVNFVAGMGGSISLPNYGKEPLIAPYPQAPPIPAGKDREYRFGSALLGKKEDLIRNKLYASWRTEVAYRDVFGQSYDFLMCFLYDARDKRYYLCPNTK